LRVCNLSYLITDLLCTSQNHNPTTCILRMFITWIVMFSATQSARKFMSLQSLKCWPAQISCIASKYASVRFQCQQKHINIVYVFSLSSYFEITYKCDILSLYGFIIFLSLVLYLLTRTWWQDKLCHEMEMGFFHMKNIYMTCIQHNLTTWAFSYINIKPS
jgi:hypothetical protein